jgi:hypothetical protein
MEVIEDRHGLHATLIASQILCAATHNNCNAESIFMQISKSQETSFRLLIKQM